MGFLVLNRGVGESLMIGENVEVKVLDTKVTLDAEGKVAAVNVSLGVSAPKEIPVHRLEIFKRIKEGKPRPVPHVVSVTVEPRPPVKAAAGS